MFYFIKNFILLFTLIKCQPCIATNVQIKDNEVQHSHYENETFFKKYFIGPLIIKIVNHIHFFK
jgi:hypothetical protein